MEISRLSLIEALHWYVVLKALRVLAQRGGEAPVEEVTRAIAEEWGDEATARAWTIATTARRLVRIENGIARLTEEGEKLIREGVVRAVASEVKNVILLTYGKPVEI